MNDLALIQTTIEIINDMENVSIDTKEIFKEWDNGLYNLGSQIQYIYHELGKLEQTTFNSNKANIDKLTNFLQKNYMEFHKVEILF